MNYIALKIDSYQLGTLFSLFVCIFVEVVMYTPCRFRCIFFCFFSIESCPFFINLHRPKRMFCHDSVLNSQMFCVINMMTIKICFKRIMIPHFFENSETIFFQRYVTFFCTDSNVAKEVIRNPISFEWIIFFFLASTSKTNSSYLRIFFIHLFLICWSHYSWKFIMKHTEYNWI